MSAWGTGWGKENETEMDKAIDELLATGQSLTHVKLDKANNFKITHIPKFLNNKPTHDPYTNPNAHIYYECGCGAILDPGTKSFAQLNNHASNAGWKVRFGQEGYTPYCVKCGENVE